MKWPCMTELVSRHCPERQREKKTRNTTGRISDILVKIWTRHCPNTTIVSHRYTKLLRRWCTYVQFGAAVTSYATLPQQTSTDLCIHIWRNIYFQTFEFLGYGKHNLHYTSNQLILFVDKQTALQSHKHSNTQPLCTDLFNVTGRDTYSNHCGSEGSHA